MHIMHPVHEFCGNQGDRSGRGSGRGRGRGRPKHEFTFRYQRPSTAERPLLRSQKQPTPELLVLPDAQDQPQSQRFAPIANLSDSDEADMELSSDGNHDAERPRKKRIVEVNRTTAASPVPKWSNPDPYTVLPPPDESLSKRVDVVKLIRKARVLDTAPQQPKLDPVSANEDFISFGSLGNDSRGSTPGDAPREPRSHLQTKESALGNRKRTYDDEVKGFSRKTGKPLSRFNIDGSIIDEWKIRPYETGTPWLSLMEPTMHFGTRLQNEILAFYHWAKPQRHEHLVRTDLVSRLQSAFENRYYGVQLRCFGSFASGVYLPTADIDLVLLSTNFIRMGRKTFGERKGQIYAFAAFLKTLDIAVPNSIEAIASARVPILKFVDKISGLRVDLSFDNDSGLIANGTFERWKSEFPMMPVIVFVIKQFLLLRGLNEVPTGGLGGLSITCLVMSLLQHLPHGHVECNLASLLMDFFGFYGKMFDFDNVGIRMNPPGYFNKRVYRSYREGNNGRLAIEDPNNADNDISGGTSEIALIFKAFSDAHRLLRRRILELVEAGSADSGSILGVIIAANYDEYTQQRWQLRKIFETSPKFASYREPPPPPSPVSAPIPPPPPEPLPTAPQQPESKTKPTKQQRKQQASQDRAIRLRKLRPDLNYVPEAVSNSEALKLGGYETQSAMDKDLLNRERAMSLAS